MKASDGHSFLTIGNHQNCKYCWIKNQPEDAVTTTTTWAVELPDETMDGLHQQFFFVDAVQVKCVPSEIAPNTLWLIPIEGNASRLCSIVDRFIAKFNRDVSRLKLLKETIQASTNGYLWVPEKYVVAPPTDE